MTRKFIPIGSEVLAVNRILSACICSNDSPQVWVEVQFVGGGYTHISVESVEEGQSYLDELCNL